MRRVQQVAVVLKKELAPLIREVLDNKFGIVTLIDVIVQPDLKEAKVYISCLDLAKEKEVLKILNLKTKEFQHTLGRRLRMKFTPRLTFVIDSSLENVVKVEELLEEIKAKKDN
ncbi:MAG: 30S ribosome-binding factor RbfA [Patescibacteria group bacterium]|nr:30S ribosome-binding factor RbfA [Patescibacteria group bacterium]